MAAHSQQTITRCIPPKCSAGKPVHFFGFSGWSAAPWTPPPFGQPLMYSSTCMATLRPPALDSLGA
eukprot:10248561-Alexandrium_andersonii.AAC.1